MSMTHRTVRKLRVAATVLAIIGLAFGFTPVVDATGSGPAGGGGSGRCIPQSATPGSTVPAGMQVIVREHLFTPDFNGVEAWVWFTNSSPELRVGHAWNGDPRAGRAVWFCQQGLDWSWMPTDACNEVLEIWAGLLTRRPSNVHLQGHRTFPDTCIDP